MTSGRLQQYVQNLSKTSLGTYAVLLALFIGINVGFEFLTSGGRFRATDIDAARTAVLCSVLTLLAVLLYTDHAIERFADSVVVCGVVEFLFAAFFDSTLMPSRRLDVLAMVSTNRTFLVSVIAAAEIAIVDILLDVVGAHHHHH